LSAIASRDIVTGQSAFRANIIRLT
jgi:hypothetical protein